MAEYISQQLMYQDGISIANQSNSYSGTQIFESQIQEIDKGLLAKGQVNELYDIYYTFIEYDKGNLINTITGIDTAAYSYTQYFKMRGFYTTDSSYETWTSANLPNLNPPSGNALTDIVIVAVWFA